MKQWAHFMLALAVTALLPGVSTGSSVQQPDCPQLGFTDALRCSSCEQLLKVVKDEELYNDCKSCCTDDVVTATTYSAVELIICRCKLHAFPHIQTFINKKAKAYTGLKVTLTNDGQYPKMLMTSTEGSAQTIPIDRWKTETLEEFLRSNLKPVGAS
eukprot:NODE_4414_length_582_cov_215.707317_g3200_i0.p2 GENE.NODE_4414_length_582_cov_215.707317_g3200_i0~~NODE_4414_length_582_cov_215.707317_g3200_i0.p2  ORF type:complete len:174 (-),score=51.24 NODE_4414_length_582_cov_215.707317_g3200_i0:61-531(-)